MKIGAGVLVWLLASGASRSAHAGLDEYSQQSPAQPSKALFEASCDLDIDLRGAIATFEMRQRIVNPSANALAARLDLAIPRGGVITGATYRGDGAVDNALRVPLKANTVTADSPEVLGPDPVWIRTTGMR